MRLHVLPGGAARYPMRCAGLAATCWGLPRTPGPGWVVLSPPPQPMPLSSHMSALVGARSIVCTHCPCPQTACCHTVMQGGCCGSKVKPHADEEVGCCIWLCISCLDAPCLPLGAHGLLTWACATHMALEQQVVECAQAGWVRERQGEQLIVVSCPGDYHACESWLCSLSVPGASPLLLPCAWCFGMMIGSRTACQAGACSWLTCHAPLFAPCRAGPQPAGGQAVQPGQPEVRMLTSWVHMLCMQDARCNGVG